MTEKVFFDTDGISAFMWAHEVNVIAELFGPNIVFPGEVYDELSNPVVPQLKAMADELISSGVAKVVRIEFGSSEYIVLRGLSEDNNGPIIGKGESAAIALAYVNKGIMASNNLKDIAPYIKKYGLINMTSLDIFKLAEERGIIEECEAESIWREMKRRGIMLPPGSYTENKGND